MKKPSWKQFFRPILALAFLLALCILTNIKAALVVMTIIFIHENAHLWAARKFGKRTKGMIFLPFLGAVGLVDDDSNLIEDYWIAFAGPFSGLILAILSLLLASVYQMDYFYLVAFVCAMINLFNLLPLSVLDGGHMAKAILLSVHPALYIGFAFLATLGSGALFFLTSSMVIGLVAVFTYSDLRNEIQLRAISKKEEEIAECATCGILVLCKGDGAVAIRRLYRIFQSRKPVLSMKQVGMFTSAYCVLVLALVIVMAIAFLNSGTSSPLEMFFEKP